MSHVTLARFKKKERESRETGGLVRLLEIARVYTLILLSSRRTNVLLSTLRTTLDASDLLNEVYLNRDLNRDVPIGPTWRLGN